MESLAQGSGWIGAGIGAMKAHFPLSFPRRREPISTALWIPPSRGWPLEFRGLYPDFRLPVIFYRISQ